MNKFREFIKIKIDQYKDASCYEELPEKKIFWNGKVDSFEEVLNYLDNHKMKNNIVKLIKKEIYVTGDFIVDTLARRDLSNVTTKSDLLKAVGELRAYKNILKVIEGELDNG